MAGRDKLGLPAREARLLAELLSGKSVEAAGRAAGISRSAAYRIRDKDVFQKALRAAREELLENIIDMLRASGVDAAKALRDVFSAASLAPQSSARVSAARESLAALFRGIEVWEIESRLAKLEAIAIETQEGPNN